MAWIHNVEKIPPDILDEARQAWVAIPKVQIATGDADLITLFEVFNKYINPTPTDRNCTDCVSRIMKFWKTVFNG